MVLNRAINLMIIFSLLFIPFSTYGASLNKEIGSNFDSIIVSKLSREIEIPAGSDYYIKFSSENLSLNGDKVEPYSKGLTEKEIRAIVKSPNWIQRKLTRQFLSLDNSEEYVDLILNSSKQYTDEISFSIACSPLNNLPLVEILKDNVYFLYENDKWIQYSDIVDYDDGFGDYYSTIRYRIIKNGTEKPLELPREIYYWYIVHPKISTEKVEYIYDKFWREYLFNHNDLGYPLLKEKLSKIKYLWDCDSYNQPKHRLWTESIENHPTAIEAISYWIGKTVPAQAIGDRPSQPNIIAHEHNGWCGELQRIAVAAQRTSLIPSIGANNVGEDHVWREFFERGWHQNDNWWADGGGTVDKPDVYEYGWGKNMSAVYSWKGDDSIYETTARYIHPQDRYKIKFSVKDIFLQPIDGARVAVLVQGIKDITWIKNKIWEKIEEIWDRLPQIMKGRILQSLYQKIEDRFEKIPDIVDGLTLSTWNFTDSNGQCTIDLGKGHSYLFIIQQGNLRRFWQLATNNAIRFMSTPSNKTIHILFLNPFHKVQKHRNKEMIGGEYHFNVSFSTKSYQLQKNIWYDTIGSYEDNGKIDFFILDENNFNKYLKGRKYNCYHYIEGKQANINFSAIDQNWYILFRNHARRTNVIVDFSIKIKASTNKDVIEIISPDTTVFEKPFFNIGETINITGIANEKFTLNINDEIIEISPIDNEWFYNWNASNIDPGEYIVTAKCGNNQDEISMSLIDEFPPEIRIKNPINEEIVGKEIITILGTSWDNHGVKKIEVALDEEEYKIANGTLNWSIECDTSELELGEHTISVKASDIVGKESTITISITVNESGHNWNPDIIDFYHTPDNPLNTSNIVIYANATKASPFEVKKVVLYMENNTEINSYEMYRYGINPIQDRHEEDPLFNKSNNPLFGYELGQLPTGENIKYWIEAFDSANNSEKSQEKNFIVRNY